MSTQTPVAALTIENGKAISDAVYYHAHNMKKSKFSSHQHAAKALGGFWRQLTFTKDSVGAEWQDCALTMLTAIENEQYTGYDAVERLHSACGMLNQTIRDALNLEASV